MIGSLNVKANDIFENNRVIRLYSFSSLICVIFAFSQMLSIPVLAYLGAVLCFVYVVLGAIDNVLLFVFFLCPNTYYIMIDSYALCGYLSLILCFRIILKNGAVIPSRLALGFFFLLLYCMLLCISYAYTSLIVAIIKIMAFMFMLICVFRDTYDRKRLIYILSNAYVLGALVCGLLGILNYMYKGMPIIATNQYYRFSGLTSDANYFCATIGFAISLLIVNILLIQKARTIDFFVLGALIGIGFLPLSRGYIVAVLLVLIEAGIYLFSSRKISFKRKLIILFASFFLVMIIVTFFDSLIDLVVLRFSTDTGGGSGRLEIWSWYLSRFASSLRSFFLGSGSIKIQLHAGNITNGPHNTYIEMLYELGVVGVLIFVINILNVGREFHMYSTGKRVFNIMLYAPLTCVIVLYMFISAFNGENFILCLLYSVAIITFLGE